MTIADAGDRSAQSVMIACIRGWLVGSLATMILIVVWTLATEGGQIHADEILALPVMVVSATFLITVLSLPFMAFAAVPLAMLVARFFRNAPYGNAAIGAVIGATTVCMLRWMMPNSWFSLQAFYPLPLLAGAIYGAATGHQLTRTLYA